MQQVTASIPGDQDIGPHSSGDGWLTALAVHRGSFVPLHRQIHDLVRQEIAAGRLAPGSRLPSEGALAEQWGVSLAPVRQALIHLAAVLSVSIGLLNLFPIPLLDGGHLLFYGIEAVRGRPLSERAQMVGFRIGLAIVVMLMIFAAFNDLRPYLTGS